MRISAALPTGVAALLFESAARRRAVESRLLPLLEVRGYGEAILPVLDYADPYQHLLDERQRGELVANFQRQLVPSAEDAVKALSDVLGAAAGGNLPDSGEPLTPDRALDLAVESAERTGLATSQLLEAATQASQMPDAELTPEQVQLKEAFEKELAALDEQIEEQKARVERARQARDAAEAP